MGDGDVTGVIDADTVRDWWRLRVLLIAASTAFSSLYWLHFSAILLGTVILSAFLVPYLSFYGEHLQVCIHIFLSLLGSCRCSSPKLNPKLNPTASTCRCASIFFGLIFLST